MEWALNGVVHGAYFLTIFIEFGLNCIEFKWRHFWIIITVGILYMMLNAGVTLSTGNPIYPGMDFVSLFGYVLVVIALVLTFFVFYFG